MLFVCIVFGFGQQLTQPRSHQTSADCAQLPAPQLLGRRVQDRAADAHRTLRITGPAAACTRHLHSPGHGPRCLCPFGHYVLHAGCIVPEAPGDSGAPSSPGTCHPPSAQRAEVPACPTAESAGVNRGALVLLFALRFPFHVCSLWSFPRQPLQGSPTTM